MVIHTFLPHVGVFGGVRRYLELGNAWVDQGHDVRLFHPHGDAPGWLPYRGEVLPLAEAASFPAHAALCGDPHTFAAFQAQRVRTRVYYCVLEHDPGLPPAIADPDMHLAANSTPLRRSIERRARRPVLDGIGGINLSQFRPDPAQRAPRPLRVLVNGRRSRPKKGTDLILTALRSLKGMPEFEIVLFDSRGGPGDPDPRDGARLPSNARFVLDASQEELVRLYQSAHVFVAAERKAGWCNTALEAMACGCAVVCTRSGTTDFARSDSALTIPWRHPFFIARGIRRLLEDARLRNHLSERGPAATIPWSWDRLARKLVDQLATR